jgi:hypothetical protein
VGGWVGGRVGWWVGGWVGEWVGEWDGSGVTYAVGPRPEHADNAAMRDVEFVSMA